MTAGRKPTLKTANEVGKEEVAKAAGNLQSLERALGLLKAVTYSENGLSLKELAKAAGLSKSTTHRIANALVQHGMLAQTKDEKMFVPGAGLYSLGLTATRFFSLVNIAKPDLRKLADLTEDSVFLTIIEGDESVCIDRIVGEFPIKVLTLDVGVRRPLGVGAASLALFAALADDEVSRIIEQNSASRLKVAPSLTNATLLQAVKATRKLGYALSYEHVVSGMGAVSMCIYNGVHQPVAAITISAIKQRLENERLLWIVDQLRTTAANICRKLEAMNDSSVTIEDRLKSFAPTPHFSEQIRPAERFK
jgi:DNA-binding IclR family transcriptional regulator